MRISIISDDDLKAADVEIVHRDLTQFRLSWLRVNVWRNKFVARTNDPSQYAPLKDLMISIFKILEHTPADQMGMNIELVYKIDTEESWHKIGNNLVPKKYWEGPLPKGGGGGGGGVGLTSLTVSSPRPDDLKGLIKVSIGPSKTDFKGVRFGVNNHIELKFKEGDREQKHDPTLILAEYWDNSLSFAKKSCEEILTKAISE